MMNIRLKQVLFLAAIVSSNSLLFANAHPTPPTISALAPSNPHVGDTVVLTGTGFEANSFSSNKVYFINKRYVSPGVFLIDSIQANVINVTSSTIKAITPLGAINGIVSVSINGQSAISPEIYFIVVPTITEFIPNTGSVGDTITITGTGFDSKQPWANYVWFTNGNNTNAISASPTSIKVIVPIGTTTGPIKVFTNGPGPISSFNFTIVPLVSYLSYYSGAVGESVTIYGTGFDPTMRDSYQISFNGVTSSIGLIQSVFIQTSVPFRASSGSIVLRFNGNIVKGSDLYFYVNPTQPIIRSYSVSSGTVGTPITIIGSGFDQSGPPLTVQFGEAFAKIERYNQDTIYTKVPRGASSGPILVTAGGIPEYGFGLVFRVLEKVKFVTIKNAKVGDTVTVAGTGFAFKPADYYKVAFSSGAIIRTSTVTDSTLSFIVPYNATSGNPTIYSDYNLSISIRLPHLGIIPIINTLKPDTVISGRNQTITISGTGFGRTSQTKKYKIAFAGNVSQTNISSNGYTNEPSNGYVEIRTIVPSEAKSGWISLVIDSLEAISPLSLIVLPDTFPYKPNPPEIIALNSITSTSFVIKWNRPYRALGFLLDVSTDDFSTFLNGFKSANVTDTLKSISGLLEGTKYQLRIRSYSDTDTSDYSYPLVVTTIPPKPLATNPTLLKPFEFLIQWSGSKGSEGYLVDLSIDLFKTYESVNVKENSLGIRVLNSDLPFFGYRVRAYNMFGISDYSNTITVLVTEVESSIKNITLYPNPSSDYIKISGLDDQVIESSVIDSSGKVRSVNLLEESDHISVLDISSFSEGLYVLHIVTSSSKFQLKFIKL
jgi:Secretion system C-terminal sorting domain/IPT/TIG domain